MWLVSSWQLPISPISHVPSPPRIQMIAVAHTNRAMPASVTRKPNTSAGTVLASRWSQPPCSSGAKRMPLSPSASRGLIPLPSSDCPVSWSTSSIR